MDELGEPAAGPDRLGHPSGVFLPEKAGRGPGRAGLSPQHGGLYNKHLVELQDWSALMDTSGAVAWVSVLLLAVTLILDLFCLWAEGKLNEEERGKGGPEEPEIRREA